MRCASTSVRELREPPLITALFDSLKSISASASSIRAAVGARERLARDLLGLRAAELADLLADLGRGPGASPARSGGGFIETTLAVLLVPGGRAHAGPSPTRRASLRISSASIGLTDQLLVLFEHLARFCRALSASAIACSIFSRRRVDHLRIGPNAYFRNTENVIPKQMIVQIINPGGDLDQWARASIGSLDQDVARIEPSRP